MSSNGLEESLQGMADPPEQNKVMWARRELDYIAVMRKGKQVKRFHTENIIGEETVGHHTYGVICWVMALTSRMASRQLILSALYHDTDEQVLGDMPGPSKWHNKDIDDLMESYRDDFRTEHRLHTALTNEDHHTLRWADKLDLLMCCYDQERMGNIRGVEIGRKVVCRLETYQPHPLGTEMLKLFLHRHPQYNSDQMIRGEYYE